MLKARLPWHKHTGGGALRALSSHAGRCSCSGVATRSPLRCGMVPCSVDECLIYMAVQGMQTASLPRTVYFIGQLHLDLNVSHDHWSRYLLCFFSAKEGLHQLK